MRIISKERERTEPIVSHLFFFEFLNRDEADAFVASLRYCAAQLPEAASERLLYELAAKIEYRCDRDTADDYNACTAYLRMSEMASFAKVLVECMWVYEDFARMIDDLLSQMDDDDADILLPDDDDL